MSDQKPAQCLCMDHPSSALDRPELFLPIILVMFASSVLLFTLSDFSFGIQIASLIPYTLLIILATFSAQRGQQPYYFECDIVEDNMSRLARRHVVFLVILLAVETASLQMRPYLPPSWLIESGKRYESPFNITLSIICMCLAFFQIMSNRSILERAHSSK